MVLALIPSIVLVLGAVLYLLAKPDAPKLAELGRLAYACGLLVLLFALAGKALSIAVH